MIGKYKKKPVVVDVIQLTEKSVKEVLKFIYPDVKSFSDAIVNGILDERYLYIETLEGRMKASFNDYIIKGISGEYYPCRKDIFEKTYEEVWTIPFKKL